MCRSVGHVEPVFVTTVKVVWFQERSSTVRSHSTNRLMATFSSVVPSRRAMSSSICEAIQRTKFALPGRNWVFSFASRCKPSNAIVRIVDGNVLSYAVCLRQSSS